MLASNPCDILIGESLPDSWLPGVISQDMHLHGCNGLNRGHGRMIYHAKKPHVSIRKHEKHRRYYLHQWAALQWKRLLLLLLSFKVTRK